MAETIEGEALYLMLKQTTYENTRVKQSILFPTRATPQEFLEQSWSRKTIKEIHVALCSSCMHVLGARGAAVIT